MATSSEKPFPSHQITKLTGHTGPIHALSYSRGLSSTYILSGSTDRSVHLYNPSKALPNTPKSGLIQVYSAHGYEVLDIAVTDDNARFASVGGDKQVFLWDVAEGKTLRRWWGHGGRVNAVSVGEGKGDVVVSGSFDATVRIWDAKSQSMKPIQVLEDAKDSVTSVAVQEHEILSGSVDGRLRCYDLRMGMVKVDLIGQPITSIHPTSDSNAVLISTLDSTLRLMDRANGQLLRKYTGHMNKDYRIRSVTAFGDSVVLSGSEDGKLYAWDVLEGKVIAETEAHGGKVASAVTSATGRREWASGGADGTVTVWGIKE